MSLYSPEEAVVRIMSLHASLRAQAEVKAAAIGRPGEVERAGIQETTHPSYPVLVQWLVAKAEELSSRDAKDFIFADFADRYTSCG